MLSDLELGPVWISVAFKAARELLVQTCLHCYSLSTAQVLRGLVQGLDG